jgi:hypothetical protein
LVCDLRQASAAAEQDHSYGYQKQTPHSRLLHYF